MVKIYTHCKPAPRAYSYERNSVNINIPERGESVLNRLKMALKRMVIFQFFQ